MFSIIEIRKTNKFSKVSKRTPVKCAKTSNGTSAEAGGILPTSHSPSVRSVAGNEVRGSVSKSGALKSILQL